MNRIKWAFALMGLLLSLVSCDKGEEMEKDYVLGWDTLGLLILDKDGNDVMDPNIGKINPDVQYDPDMMVLFLGDTLTTRGWSHKPDYFESLPQGSAWNLKHSNRKDDTGVKRYLQMLDICAVCMYYNDGYDFEVVSPRNNYRWHLRVEYERHTVAVKHDQITRRCWVDGKRMPDQTLMTVDGGYSYLMKYASHDIILPMDK